MRPFEERTGDWICKNCRNLNFSFRFECNRCKLPKKEVMETPKSRVYKIINENKNSKKKSNLINCTNNSFFNCYKTTYQCKNSFKYKNCFNSENNNKDFSNDNKSK